MKNKILSVVALGAIFFSSFTFAEVINISRGETSGEFNCTSSSINPFTKIRIDTRTVEVKGFCCGQPYVETPGHINNLPNSTLNENYFEFKKQIHEVGTIIVTSTSDASLTCSLGRGNKSKPFSNGKYC